MSLTDKVIALQKERDTHLDICASLIKSDRMVDIAAFEVSSIRVAEINIELKELLSHV
jgi:hypothetical protein